MSPRVRSKSPAGIPARALRTGVFLDLETVDSGDLDRQRLQSSLKEWHWHAFSEPQDIPPRIAWASRTACQAALDQLAEVVSAFAAGRPIQRV